jgi:hypothetical protein
MLQKRHPDYNCKVDGFKIDASNIAHYYGFTDTMSIVTTVNSFKPAIKLRHIN